MLKLVLRGETLDSGLGWLNPVMATLGCCSVPDNIVVEELVVHVVY